MTYVGLRAHEVLLPLVGLVAFLVATMALFAIRARTLGPPRAGSIDARAESWHWKWFLGWWSWMCGPLERAFVGLGIAPGAISLASGVAAGGAGVLLAMGHLSVGGWVSLLAVTLDVLDGRVARGQGTSSAAGAFLDSTLDRTAELLVLGGLAVHFRATPVLYAVLAASGSSVILSYVRARGEALGVHEESRAGGLHRAQRAVLVGVPCAVTPLLDAGFGRGAGGIAVASAVALLAVVAILGAAVRAYSIWSVLRRQQLDRASMANVRWLDAARARRNQRIRS